MDNCLEPGESFFLIIKTKTMSPVSHRIIIAPLCLVLINPLSAVLSKLVSSLKEAESLSGEQDLDFLQQLLESKELNALVNVHTKVAKIGKDDRLAPLLSSSMQVCNKQVTINLMIVQLEKTFKQLQLI